MKVLLARNARLFLRNMGKYFWICFFQRHHQRRYAHILVCALLMDLGVRLGQNDLPIDDIAAVCLLVYFGVSTLIDAALDDGLKAEDEQKEAELAVSKFSGNGAGILSAARTVISTFALVFVAEWGDKSFFSTVALAAASSPLGVIGGSLAGHGVATLPLENACSLFPHDHYWMSSRCIVTPQGVISGAGRRIGVGMPRQEK